MWSCSLSASAILMARYTCHCVITAYMCSRIVLPDCQNCNYLVGGVSLSGFLAARAVHYPEVLLQVLPLDYDPDIIADYWGRRPVAVAMRVVQLLGIAGGFLGGLAFDFVQNRTQQNQVWLQHGKMCGICD